MLLHILVVLFILIVGTNQSYAQATRLLRNPAISRDYISFTYAGYWANLVSAVARRAKGFLGRYGKPPQSAGFPNPVLKMIPKLLPEVAVGMSIFETMVIGALPILLTDKTLNTTGNTQDWTT